MAVVEDQFFDWLELFLMAEEEGTVVKRANSKNIKHNNWFFIYPLLPLPTIDVMEAHSFFAGCFLDETQAICFTFFSHDVSDSFEKLVACDEMNLSLKFFGEADGEEETLGVSLPVVDADDFLFFY